MIIYLGVYDILDTL